MKAPKTGVLILLLAVWISGSAIASAAQRALPYPTAATPEPIDQGALSARPASTPISITLALNLRNLDQAEELLKAINTAGDPQFHHFLTSAEFVTRFGPSQADVAKVIAGLAKYGLSAQRTTAMTLKVTGTPANLERAFSVSLHQFQVPAHNNSSGYTFYAPLSQGRIPAEIAGTVSAVAGLDNRPRYSPHFRNVSDQVKLAPRNIGSAGTGDQPGEYTVLDFANRYHVVPLYKQGVSGSGRTLAILTLASFRQKDAFTYWNALGLTVASNRIRVVNVDGGPGAPSDDSGSGETTIDVEQSGGIAPGAKIIVYQAPNTNQGFLDLFAAAVEANLAETMSTSWGVWEWFDNLQNGPVTDPLTGKTVSGLVAVHQQLLRAALQGQSVFAAAGDGGAYDVNNDFGCYGPYSPKVPTSCSLTLTVDNPASDTAITAAGGTTTPFYEQFCLNADCTPPYFTVKVSHESVWGWDYFDDLCNALGYDPISCGIFPAGGGGGVSVLYGVPSYQEGLPGIQLSQPGQVFQGGTAFTSLGLRRFYNLPSQFAGRNVPDVSFDADPYSGYLLFYTSSQSGFSIQGGWGGTSFVAPQLNGVSALLGQYLQSRLGLLNYPLYDLARNGDAYGPTRPSLHAVPYGDNWFYYGSDGYNPGAGLGTLDVSNFAYALRTIFY